MSSRKSRNAGGGLLIVIVLIIVVFSWIKENVVDYTQPQVYTPIIAIIALYVADRIRKTMSSKKELRLAREAYMQWCINKAVSIATFQEWVSHHRLSRQANISEKEAVNMLEEAQTRGVLYQAVNGRYYLAAQKLIAKE